MLPRQGEMGENTPFISKVDKSSVIEVQPTLRPFGCTERVTASKTLGFSWWVSICNHCFDGLQCALQKPITENIIFERVSLQYWF